ncbi:hypothetical protein ACOQFV_07690 [Nocardiopsis changdeensis]|uniref:Pilus assembly protein TadE n=1 Tax=Nocardiopsis changdeensis TaxID=2831969 RepID=A0ABX8BE78_9ACTN|nr:MULTISPECIES: hypothetical protein [Nocardiopsis]QUX20554.1 hypothetical protein KGD84_18775 [Nocardiopsis changdeensis]QYX36485.1 hypothetical protein K1J57_28230 [Nocardiopsis sp. MT53]
MSGGSPTAFVLAIATTLLACLALAHDGARLLHAKTRTTALAHEAARTGAQHLDTARLREGAVALDPRAATAAAQAHAIAAGANAEVQVEGETVTVTVTTVRQPTVWGGLGEVEIASRATATAHTP